MVEKILDYIMANRLDTLGTVLGFAYLILEFRASVWMWVVGCIMPAIYIVVLYQAGIYADCGMEVYYFLAGIYGLVHWLRGRAKHGKDIPITRTPLPVWLRLAVSATAAYIVLALLLVNMTDSNVPYIDALTTALSIIGLWMLSRKYIEQWWIWFVVDMLSSALYIYKGVYGRSVLYGVYTLMAVYGYFVWRRRME